MSSIFNEILQNLGFVVSEGTDGWVRWDYNDTETDVDYFNIRIELNKNLSLNDVKINWSTEDLGEQDEYFEEDSLILSLIEAYKWSNEIPSDQRMSNMLWDVFNKINDIIIENH